MRLFFCNLPYSVTERHIEELLSPFGAATEVEIPLDRESQRSRGFAFADLPDEGAQRAIEALDGELYPPGLTREQGARTLRVEEARPKEPRPDVVRAGWTGAKRVQRTEAGR